MRDDELQTVSGHSELRTSKNRRDLNQLTEGDTSMPVFHSLYYTTPNKSFHSVSA